MKIKQRKKMMFGDSIMTAPKNRDARQDKLVIQLAPGDISRATAFFNSFAKGRFV
jgi:hypothetical protein